MDKIALVFDFLDDRRQFQISFFEHRLDQLLKMGVLEEKAKDWETILNNIIDTRLKKTI